jgi:hypothetical protein
MSSTSSVASDLSASDLNERDSERSASVKSIHSAEGCLPSTGPMSPAMTTCEHSITLSPTLTPSAPASLAKMPVSDKPSGEPVSVLTASELDYGEKSSVWPLTYDPASSSWKTYQVSFLPGLDEFSETWPRSGMTRSGVAFLHPRPVSPIDVTASGLLPTPAARDFRDISKGQAFLSQRSRHSPSLATKLLERGVDWTMLSTAYEAVMGLSLQHTAVASKPLATPSSRKSRKQSAAQS